MSILQKLKSEFHASLPRLASGKYVHFLLLRHSQSFPIFQTDGVLNTVKTQAGLDDPKSISRLVMFKRKQTSPERIVGRELLRACGFIDSDNRKAKNFCRYGGGASCAKCPDCVLYGFAVGESGANNQGSERSKVYSDSAFSLTEYQDSHKSFTFNALSEAGTMMLDADDPKKNDKNKNRNSINEQDHIIPDIIFPTVETLRDPTKEGFIYVLGNLLRTQRYGAQSTRTGKIKNHIVGIVFSDGEIFSNLHFTQAMHDSKKRTPISSIKEFSERATELIPEMISQEPIVVSQTITGDNLKNLLAEVTAIYQSKSQLQEMLSTVYEQTQLYAETYGATAKPKR